MAMTTYRQIWTVMVSTAVRVALETGLNDQASPAGNGPCSASNARFAAANTSSARSSVGRSWDAITLQRSNAPPSGTAGGIITLTYTPASYSAFHSSPAFQSSPTSTGTTGVTISEPFVSRVGSTTANPSAASPSCRYRALSSTAANRGGPSGERQILTAASAAPIAAGTPDAVKMNERAWILRNSITSAGPAITPPHDANDFENVAIRRS